MAFVKLTQAGHVGILTISRPEALNALNEAVLADLDQALTEVEKNDDIYVVVLTGEGKSFVAGADISRMKDFSVMQAKAFADYGNGIFLRIENLLKPVIAAVNGFALGGGCELAMACDIRIASEKAKFGQPETGLGIPPGFGGTQRMTRIIGTGRAMELILSTRVIGAEEALQIGLVNQVVAPEALMDTALELANVIAGKAQIAVRQSKRAIRRGIQTDIATGVAYEAEAFAFCFATEDQTDAMTAFVEKRKITEYKNK